MATPQDAELILKLYELRTEAVMRKARAFVGIEFQPSSFEEIQTMQRDTGSEQSAFFRQAISYWEMAAALVLHGTLDPALYLDCQGEPFFLYAKYTPFLEQFAQASGQPFMKNTAKLIEQYPAMQDLYTRMLAMMAARQKQAAS